MSIKIEQISIRIREQRKLLGKSQEQFAQFADITLKTQSQYERGISHPDTRYLAAIAAAGADISYILTGEESGGNGQIGDADGQGQVLVPQYDVEASAGSGALVDAEQVIGDFPVPSAWIRQRGLLAEHLAMLRCRGDSMSPRLLDGDWLLFDTGDTVPRSDRVYITRLGNDLLVKALSISGSGIIFSSFNQNYTPVTFPVSEVGERISIIGRVIASAHEWR